MNFDTIRPRAVLDIYDAVFQGRGILDYRGAGRIFRRSPFHEFERYGTDFFILTESGLAVKYNINTSEVSILNSNENELVRSITIWKSTLLIVFQRADSDTEPETLRVRTLDLKVPNSKRQKGINQALANMVATEYIEIDSNNGQIVYSNSQELRFYDLDEFQRIYTHRMDKGEWENPPQFKSSTDYFCFVQERGEQRLTISIHNASNGEKLLEFEEESAHIEIVGDTVVAIGKDSLWFRHASWDHERNEWHLIEDCRRFKFEKECFGYVADPVGMTFAMISPKGMRKVHLYTGEVIELCWNIDISNDSVYYADSNSRYLVVYVRGKSLFDEPYLVFLDTEKQTSDKNARTLRKVCVARNKVENYDTGQSLTDIVRIKVQEAFMMTGNSNGKIWIWF